MGLNSNGVQKVNNTCKFITALTLHYQIWGEKNKPRPFPLPGTVISGTIISQNHVHHFMQGHGRNSGFPGGSDRKESACNAERPVFNPWVGKIPWRRAWQPTLLFMLGKSTWTKEPGWLQSMGLQRVDTTK